MATRTRTRLHHAQLRPHRFLRGIAIKQECMDPSLKNADADGLTEDDGGDDGAHRDGRTADGLRRRYGRTGRGRIEEGRRFGGADL